MRAAITIAVLALAACDDQTAPTAAPPSADPTSTQSAAAAASGDPSAAPSADATASVTAPAADPSRLTLEGKAIQGGLMVARIDPATRIVKFPGHKVVIAEDGSFLVAFFHKAPAKETLTITFPDGAVLEHVFEVQQRTFPEEKIDGMPEHFFKLEGARAKRAKEMDAKLDAARDRYTKRAYYNEGCFVWPVTGEITSRYGNNRVFNKVHKDIHWGVDIAKPVGTPVKAPCGGIVSFAEADVPLAGNTVSIDHGHGLSSTLIHLDRIGVKVGDEVKPGDVIGTVGMTGRTNGPHLDWRMSFFTIRIDPELVAPPMPAE